MPRPSYETAVSLSPVSSFSSSPSTTPTSFLSSSADSSPQFDYNSPFSHPGASSIYPPNDIVESPTNEDWPPRVPRYSRFSSPRASPFNQAPPPSLSSLQPPFPTASCPSDYSLPYSMNKSFFQPPAIANMRDLIRFPPPCTDPRQFDLSNETQGVPSMFNHNKRFMMCSRDSPVTQGESPPFQDTVGYLPLYAGNQEVTPDITAKIPKNFFYLPEEGTWACYRRNYINVSTSFCLRGWTSHTPLVVQLGNGTHARVRGFSIILAAEVKNKKECRDLVQHGPKRDRASERLPPRVILQPVTMQSAATSHHSSHMTGLLDASEYMLGDDVDPPSQSPSSHTFERIQFVRATANNGKRRAMQQFYNIAVELYADIGNPVLSEPHWVAIAKKSSDGLIVRGRSPNHYKEHASSQTKDRPIDSALENAFSNDVLSPLPSNERHVMKRRPSVFGTDERGLFFKSKRYRHSPI